MTLFVLNSLFFVCAAVKYSVSCVFLVSIPVPCPLMFRETAKGSSSKRLRSMCSAEILLLVQTRRAGFLKFLSSECCSRCGFIVLLYMCSRENAPQLSMSASLACIKNWPYKSSNAFNMIAVCTCPGVVMMCVASSYIAFRLVDPSTTKIWSK